MPIKKEALARTLAGDVLHDVLQSRLGEEPVRPRQVRHTRRKQRVRQEIRDSACHLSEKIPPSNLHAVFHATIDNMGKQEPRGRSGVGGGSARAHETFHTPDRS